MEQRAHRGSGRDGIADVIGHGQAQHATDIGLKEFKPFVMGFRSAFPDLKVTIDYIIEQGDKVVARWTATMTHKGEFLGIAPTGKKATITGTSTQRISGGKIVEAGITGTNWGCWCRLEPFPRRTCGACGTAVGLVLV